MHVSEQQPYLRRHWLARLGVVKVCGDVKLEQLTEFTYDVLRSPILILPSQLDVCLDDLCQFVSQVVLRPVIRTSSGPNSDVKVRSI